VARALVEEAERRLVNKGARRVSVLAERDNAEANSFYESLRDRGYSLDTWMQRYTKRL
jgi:ribosomal protein S18 acetylase RimI-like enzyme